MKTIMTWVFLFGFIALLAHLFPYQVAQDPCPCSDNYLMVTDEALSVTPYDEVEPLDLAEDDLLDSYDLYPSHLGEEDDYAPIYYTSNSEGDSKVSEQATDYCSILPNTKRQFPSYFPSHFEGKGYMRRIRYANKDSTTYQSQYMAYRQRCRPRDQLSPRGQ